MKKLTLLLISCVLSLSIMHAEPTKEAVDQISHDLQLFVSERTKGTLSKEQLDATVKPMAETVIKEFSEAVTFSTEELQAVSHGKQIVSDQEISTAYENLKDTANGRPMPILVEFYHTSFEKGTLTPLQKAIYFRMTKAITMQTKEQLKKMER